MTEKEFIKACWKGGYCKAPIARLYVKNHPKQTYEERDVVEAYRYANAVADKSVDNRTDPEWLYQRGSWE